MLDDHNNSNNAGLNFSSSEWIGLIAAGDFAAAVSFIANTIVLIIHGFMLWYRPVVVARLSLRMIVLSCIFNMFYCVGQLVADGISSLYKPCRVLIYVLIVSDTMACMCLAMVGLNLVMIFVLRVSRSLKLEILYYVIIAVCGILVAVVPIAVDRRVTPNHGASCWYHYYFDGRLHALFNWLWYYSWLMFSSVFAAFCAVISLAFVVQKQGNFAGALDMFSFRDKDQVSKIQRLKRYSNNNTDVFKKIAKRCILYPLVPLVSKAWGIAIVITASGNGTIPYSIFVIDRVFSCLLGLMVSCIYYTDPALLAVFKEGIENLKRRYVYDYYSVKYQPGSDPTVKSKSEYPERIKIVESTSPSLGLSISIHRPPYMEETLMSPIFRAPNENSRESVFNPYETSSSSFHPYMNDIRRPSVSFKTDLPSVEVRKPPDIALKDQTPNTQRRISVISVTSTSGKTFLPNDKIEDNNNNNNKSSWTSAFDCLSKKKVQKIPMRRIIDDNRKSRGRNTSMSKNSVEEIETIVPYKFPRGAKFLHWVLVNIFRVSPSKRRVSCDEENTAPTRVFRDFTDNSNPGSPEVTDSFNVNSATASASSPKDFNLESQFKKGSSSNKNTTNNSELGSRSPPPRARSSDIIRNHDDNSSDSYREFPLRRASTINVGSLYRKNYNSLSRLTFGGRSRDINSQGTPSSSSSGFASSLGLVKMFNRGRSKSISLGKFQRSSPKIVVPTPPASPDTTTFSNHNPIEAAKNNSGSTGQMRLGEKIDKHAFDSDIKTTAAVDKPESVHSDLSVTYHFPAELSPRPTTKLGKKLDNSRVNYRHGSSKKPIPNSVSHVHQRLSIFGEDDVSSETPNEESYDLLERGAGSRSSLDAIVQQSHTTEERPTSMDTESTKCDDYMNRLSLTSDPEATSNNINDGLSQGFTAVNFISNWQDGDSDDTARIMVHSEVWNIDEQFRAQVELAEAMQHI